MKKYYQPSRPTDWLEVADDFDWQQELDAEKEDKKKIARKQKEKLQPMEEDEEEYEVEKILDCRKRKKNNQEYLVRWKGYSR